MVADSVTISSLGRTNAKPGDPLTLYGRGFYAAESVDDSGVPISNTEQAADVSLTEKVAAGAAPASIPCQVQPGSTDTQLKVLIPAGVLAGVAADAPPLTFQVSAVAAYR